jgi:hypothetical protein
MSQEAYINQILEPEVRKWCKESIKWVLEEDSDSGHSNQSKENDVIKWKRDHGMAKGPQSIYSWFTNCPQSPDLALIEEAWSYPKQYIKKRPHWGDQLVRELAKEGWEAMPQKWVNEMVEGYPQLLRDCIESGGQIVARRR